MHGDSPWGSLAAWVRGWVSPSMGTSLERFGIMGTVSRDLYSSMAMGLALALYTDAAGEL